MIRVVLPPHLRTLAKVGREIELDVSGPATQRTVLDALEATYPMLLGTVRDHATKRRRSMVRFFACEQDLSHESPDAPLPEAVASGTEPFMIVGAIAGGQCDEFECPRDRSERFPGRKRHLFISMHLSFRRVHIDDRRLVNTWRCPWRCVPDVSLAGLRQRAGLG